MQGPDPHAITSRTDAQAHVQHIIDNIEEPKLKEALQYVFDHRTASYTQGDSGGSWRLGAETQTEMPDSFVSITIGWARW